MKLPREFKPMSKEEIDSRRIKAYLSFDEEDDKLESNEKFYYKNKRGESISCIILIKRDNGEIVVQNSNGCRVCLTEKDLFKQPN